MRSFRPWSQTLFLLPFFFLLACSPAEQPVIAELMGVDDAQQITGGIEVSDRSSHANVVVMIMVDSDDGQSSVCTGTFISENLILTARHCVNKNIRRMGVLYGISPFTNSEFLSLKIVDVFLHPEPETSRDNRNDLALIQFDGGLPEGADYAELADKNLAPIDRAATPAAKGATDFLFDGLGYGRTHGVATEETDNVGSGTLRRVTLQSNDFSVNAKQFNVNQESLKRGVCDGDSGGPALVGLQNTRPIVAGVASGVYSADGVDQYASDFDSCNHYATYMNVIAYRPWILKIVKQVAAKTSP